MVSYTTISTPIHARTRERMIEIVRQVAQQQERERERERENTVAQYM